MKCSVTNVVPVFIIIESTLACCFMFQLANCLLDGTTRVLRAMDEDSSQLAAVN